MMDLVLNQSSLKAWLNCNRLYGWYRIEKLEAPMRRSATEIGTAVHAGLADFHSSGGSTERALEVARTTLATSAGPKSRFEDKDLAEAQSIVDRLLPAYFQHWGAAGELWAPLEQEIQFLVEVGSGTRLFLRGRADNLTIFLGALWLVDYKTAAKLDPRDLLKYEMDMQLSAYIYGISKQLTIDSLKTGGEPMRVEGAIIDVLVKTAVPQFAREQYTRSDEELLEFESDFIEYGRRIRAQHERVADGEPWKKVFPKNTEQCFRYGTCAFRDLCLKDTPVRREAYVTRKPDYVDEAVAELAKEGQTK